MANENGATAQGLTGSGIAPSLTVNDLQKSLDFYMNGFGFEIERKGERDGKLVFAMLRAGDTRLGVGQDDFAKGRDRKKGVAARLWIYTGQDLHALAGRAKGAGVNLDADPAPLPFGGNLAFSFSDPDGFLFTIANPRQ